VRDKLAASYVKFLVGNDSTPPGRLGLSRPPDIDHHRRGADTVPLRPRELIWADGAARKRVAPVTVRPMRNRPAEADVFYFGNAIGESGNTPPRRSHASD